MPEGLQTAVIREDDEYGGLRITLPARLGKCRAVLRLDISFGDPITPRPQLVQYPQFNGSAFPLLTYPVEAVISEKLVTALHRGATNTRDRDYADIWRLTGRRNLRGTEIRLAVERTASHRDVRLRALSETLPDSDRRQPHYAAWRRKQGSDGAAYPEMFVEVVAGVVRFADPLLANEVAGVTWHARTRSWAN